MQALSIHPDSTAPESTHFHSTLVLGKKMMRDTVMEQPSPTPEPQKQTLWRPMALMAAAVGLGGALLAVHGQPSSPPRTAPHPEPQLQPSTQAVPVLEGALTLSMLPPDEAARAIARSSFPEQQKPALLAALKDNRIRLAAMPLADATGSTGQVLTVSGGGLSQQVILGPRMKAVLLPIVHEGTVTFTRTSPAGRGPLSIATLNMFNNIVVLPPLTTASPAFSVPVVVQ